MGLSVSVSHSIFLVALLVGGAALGQAVLQSHADVGEARREEARMRDAAVHTTIAVTATQWSPPAERLTVTLENRGSTVLDVRLLDFVADGAWVTDRLEAGWTVDGASTNWWGPGTELTAALSPFTTRPSDLVVATEHGTKTMWRE